MDADEIWRNIDDQRTELSEFLSGLTPTQWTAPSLCDGWRVRDVAAHLTHAHMSLGRALAGMLKAGFRFDPMIKQMAIEDDRSQAEITAALAGMAGSRRKPPGTRPVDPLTDLLVHGQDIAVPLGIDWPMPIAAATAVADHLWHSRFPLRPSPRVGGLRLVATDADFAEGAGPEVRAPIRDIVMMLAGRAEP